MKVVKKLIIFLLMTLIFSACSGPSTDSAEKIVSPQNQLIPIRGTWEIGKVLVGSAFSEEDKDQRINEKVIFSNEYMSIGGSIVEKPQYQIKKINGQQYLMFNSKSLPEGFAFPQKEIEVITIIDDDKFFCELLLIGENELILKIQNSSFYLNKIYDEVDEYTNNQNDAEDKENLALEKSHKEPISTGVLIGLRSTNLNDGGFKEDYTYRTLWVSSIDGEIDSILEMENIFFPRRSGFWKLNIERAVENNRIEEYIAGHNVLAEEEISKMQLKNKEDSLGVFSTDENNKTKDMIFSKWGDKLGQIKRKINYVSNDYISIDTTGKGSYIVGDELWEKSHLQIIPVDGLPSGQGVEISDILGEVGKESMKAELEKIAENLEIEKHNILYEDEILGNFGLERRLGHWLLKGRINYSKDKKFNIANYNINLIPPSKVVVYDTLHVPWTNVKDRVPRALDVYTSSNKDIALIFTKNELLIYNIHGNKLGSYPIERIQLKDGEAAIMVEWATGHYVEIWENIFKKSKGTN